MSRMQAPSYHDNCIQIVSWGKMGLAAWHSHSPNFIICIVFESQVEPMSQKLVLTFANIKDTADRIWGLRRLLRYRFAEAWAGCWLPPQAIASGIWNELHHVQSVWSWPLCMKCDSFYVRFHSSDKDQVLWWMSVKLAKLLGLQAEPTFSHVI
jgi:hypothetical protein